MLPSSLTHRSAAATRASGFLTSTAPRPNTFAPFLAVAMSLAMFSVFSTLRPMMQALAPRCTRARTWPEHIEPAPPVQKTTLLSRRTSAVSFRVLGLECCGCTGVRRGVAYRRYRLSKHRSHIGTSREAWLRRWSVVSAESVESLRGRWSRGGEVGKGSKNILLGLVSAIVGDIYRIVSAVLLLRPKG